MLSNYKLGFLKENYPPLDLGVSLGRTGFPEYALPEENEKFVVVELVAAVLAPPPIVFIEKSKPPPPTLLYGA